VSPVQRARTPRTALYRIGRLPDPLAWQPWEYVGSGRFDDPVGEFRVLYAAAQRRAAFIETLAPFRPSLEALVALQGVMNTDELLPIPVVPPHWYRGRAVGRFRLAPHQRWLDLRSMETREVLRRELAQTLLELGLEDLDLSGVVGPRRQLTQAIARWAYEHGYNGLAYSSRFDAALTCWGVFEGAAFEVTGPPEPILPDDPGLLAAARLFGLFV
jgi:RES domain